MPSVRTPGIPLWVTVLAIVLGLFATGIGLLALASPSAAIGYVAGADTLATGWAGRNAGLGIALLMAVALRSAYGYVVAFAAQVLREVSDIVNATPNAAGVAVALVFLLADVLGLVAGLRAVRSEPRPASA